jgi:hypothetical protein
MQEQKKVPTPWNSLMTASLLNFNLSLSVLRETVVSPSLPDLPLILSCATSPFAIRLVRIAHRDSDSLSCIIALTLSYVPPQHHHPNHNSLIVSRFSSQP